MTRLLSFHQHCTGVLVEGLLLRVECTGLFVEYLLVRVECTGLPAENVILGLLFVLFCWIDFHRANDHIFSYSSQSLCILEVLL